MLQVTGGRPGYGRVACGLMLFGAEGLAAALDGSRADPSFCLLRTLIEPQPLLVKTVEVMLGKALHGHGGASGASGGSGGSGGSGASGGSGGSEGSSQGGDGKGGERRRRRLSGQEHTAAGGNSSSSSSSSSSNGSSNGSGGGGGHSARAGFVGFAERSPAAIRRGLVAVSRAALPPIVGLHLRMQEACVPAQKPYLLVTA